MRRLFIFLLVFWSAILYCSAQRINPARLLVPPDRAGQKFISYPAASNPLADFKWRLYTHEAFVSHFIGHSSLVIVPDKIQGVPVTRIGHGVFFRCNELSNVILPDTVIEIGASAFNRCYQLKSITIPKGVLIIRESTFFRCYKLKEIIIPDRVHSIKEYAFSRCKSLNDIVIPKKVNSIERHAFSNCENLKNVVFLGDAPNEVSDVFKGSTPTIYRSKGSTGWKATWSGRPVKLISEKPKI